MPELEGKKVLITGAGSLGGLGADTAQLFAQEGAEVLVTGRHTERGQQVVKTILQAGGTARFLLADLRKLDDVAQLADEAGEVDVLVNNAAAFNLESTAEDFSLIYDTNVRAPFFLVQKLAPGMLARRSGSIVSVSSTAASVALPGGMAIYGSSKSALESLTRYWAIEFANSNVRVNAVSAGPISTANPMATWEAMGPGVIEGMAASIPLGRWASPREMSQIILFLASERSSFVTGSIFDGGGGRSAVSARSSWTIPRSSSRI
jgi:NAD(P)-dependent dehydrogenase (short-subunit alcohol dehydrogenase family)